MKDIQDINIGISNFILIFISGFVVLFYFLGFGGLILSDDFTYSYYANHFFQGTFELSDDIFAHRFSVFIPTGILYILFGINDVTTTAWPFLCFLTSGFLLFLSFKNKNITIAVYALILSSLNFYPLFFSNKLFPDVVVSFFSLASIIALYKFRQESKKAFLGPFLFSAAFIAGFLSKETILYLLPFYGLVFINDMVKGKNYFFWLASINIFIVFTVVYMGVYRYFTGDFFYRFKVIHDGHYVSGGSYFDKPFDHVIRRISYEPFLMLISSEIFIPFALALPLIAQLKPKDIFNLDQEEKFWAILSVFLLLMFWFAGTSYSYYNPIVLNPRMFIMLVPVLSVVAGMSIYKAKQSIKIYLCYALLFLGAACLSIITNNSNISFIYGLLFLCFLGFYIYSKSFQQKQIHSILLFSLMVILLIHPVYSMLNTDRGNFENSKEMIQSFLNETKGKFVVLTDPFIKSGSVYFHKFIPNNHYTYVNYRQAGELKNMKADRYFILINPKNIQELTDMGYPIPEYFKTPLKQWKLIQKRGDISLFEITNVYDIADYQ